MPAHLTTNSSRSIYIYNSFSRNFFGMSLKLERGDLLQIEPISFTGTLKLLPVGTKKKVSFHKFTKSIASN
jgi:hypothetical protein